MKRLRITTIAVLAIVLILLLVLKSDWVAFFEGPNQYTVNQLSTGGAGYAVGPSLDGKVTFVNGTWTVPQVDCSSGQASALLVWVGLGGLKDSAVEQIGTKTGCNNGTAYYSAWYEFLPPQPNTMLIPSFNVKPGDVVSASIAYSNSTRNFQLLIVDGKETFTYLAGNPDASVSSAEWVVEAPLGSGGQRQTLTSFGSIQFSRSFATVNNHTMAISGFGKQSYSTLFQLTYACGNQTKAMSGPLTGLGDAFLVTRLGSETCNS